MRINDEVRRYEEEAQVFLAQAQTLIEQQERVVAQLDQLGRPTAEAEAVLDALRRAFVEMERHTAVVTRCLSLQRAA